MRRRSRQMKATLSQARQDGIIHTARELRATPVPRRRLRPEQATRRYTTRPTSLVCLLLIPGCLGDDTYDSEPKADEWYMVLIFSLLFGFFISLFGAFVGYFALLEDALMRQYRDKGELVKAEVVSVLLARGLRHGRRGKPNPEYIVLVEYNRVIAISGVVRIRKQVKARESDFGKPCYPGLPTTIKTHGLPTAATGDEGDEWCMRYVNLDDKTPERIDYRTDPTTIPNYQFLELLVLQDHDRSGYPRHQVERACGLRYRLSTLVLVAFDLALAAFCTTLAANSVLDREEQEKRIGLHAIVGFVILISLEVPLIHLLLHRVFANVLRHEYLENGEYLHVPCGNSSISSGSDVYLSQSHAYLQELTTVAYTT